MVELTRTDLIPAGQAARAEARRLRGDMAVLRRAVRESAAHSLDQRLMAEQAAISVALRRDEPLPSPWSSLQWSSNTASLAGVLVPLG